MEILTTTLIPKEDTDRSDIANYQPIALLNLNYKICVTIIANRLRKILSAIIHLDQNDCLPTRKIQNYFRTTLNVLEYYEKHSGKQLVLIFLDAEKAFYNVSWTFIKMQLEYMEFGHRNLQAIEQIYYLSLLEL